MPAAVRRFDRRDRDQVTALVNLHVAAVVPGVVLSVNAVLAQLEREPGETVVDPWVAERCCLVVERDHRITAAALLHRFRGDAEVREGYRGTGDIRWLLCHPDARTDGHDLLQAALAQMRRWGVTSVGADCNLPAPGCYGVPDTAPHLRELLDDAGFTGPTRTELVLAARCADLLGADLAGATVVRTVGTLGPRLTLTVGGEPYGYIEVAPVDLARSAVAANWADVGNLIVPADADSAVVPALLTAAAEWLLLGGTTRLIEYWAADVDPPGRLEALRAAGFGVLVRNQRGFQRAP